MISNIMIQNTTQDFKKILLHLINETVRQARVPQRWKESMISLIPKKKQQSSNPKDYRPISLTSCLCKLAERMILAKLKEHLEKNHLIIKQQSGFRKQRQTRDNIFHLTQKALETLNRGKKMCAIFFDVASAFDKVWHDGLVYKLIEMKLPSYITCWIKNFLDNRQFKVRVNESKTQLLQIQAGVPQGAVLSPTLFSIYINDIPVRYNKNKFYSLLFADDLCAFKIYKHTNSVNKQIQAYLNLIEKWLKKWRLMMAPQKCNYIEFTSDKTSKSKLDIKLFGSTIAESTNPTFLGIRFDKYLSFKNQINYVKDACTKRMNVLKVLSNRSWGLTVKTLNEIFNSLIRSLMEYSSILYPSFSETNIGALEQIQIRSLKIISKTSKFESNETIRKMPNYTSIADRFDKLNVNYIQNCLRNKNEIIVDLHNEYVQFSESRELRKKTLFCKYVREIRCT